LAAIDPNKDFPCSHQTTDDEWQRSSRGQLATSSRQPFANAGVFPQRLLTFAYSLQTAAKTFDETILFGPQGRR
jgi:hypothetical protein